MKRTFISAAAILAFAATAHADELTDIQAQAKQLREQNAAMTKRLADLEKRQKALETKPAVVTVNPVDALAADLPYKAAVKAKPVENDDICWHGVCLYGNFDAGLAFIQHGAPNSPNSSGGFNSLVSRNGGIGSYFGFAPDQLSTSFIGLRGKQEIADNLYAVFNLQTLFNPGSGQNSSGLGTISQNNGLLNGFQNAFGDSSKAGQLFNNAGYFGLSSPTYGTLTIGRQSALSSDLIVNYDPLSGSNFWSVITFQGANGGGGDTENRTFNNSFEYRLNIGPVRLAVETQLRDGGNSAIGNAFQGNIGFDYLGLSVDFLGGKIYDAASSSPLAVNGGTAVITSLPIGNGQVASTITDNTTFQAAARYTIGPWKLYGGYEWIQYANPNNPLAPGAFLDGSYIAATTNNCAEGAGPTGISGTGSGNCVNNNRILQTAWFGVRYAITPALDITGAYYHEQQNNFATGVFSSTTGGGLAGTSVAAACAALKTNSAQCSGSLDAVSLVLDWRFARHVDVYAGIMYSQANGGLASGFFVNNLGTTVQAVGRNSSSNYDPGIGLRYQF